MEIVHASAVEMVYQRTQASRHASRSWQAPGRPGIASAGWQAQSFLLPHDEPEYPTPKSTQCGFSVHQLNASLWLASHQAGQMRGGGL
eukprot:6184792-Pleurochrysis_carterae.AAC.1